MKRKIAEAFPVSTFILEEIVARGWTKAYFLGKKNMRKGLLTGSKITVKDATALANLFGTSVAYWLNLQKIWFASLQVELEEEGKEVSHD